MNRPRFDPEKARKRRLAAIHAAKKQLGLEDDVYRDLVERIAGGGVRSAADCNSRQLDAVANELRRLGGMPAKRAQEARVWAGRPKGDLKPQVAKIEALLADAGREWEYAHALARRICKVNRVEWCNADQLSKLIAALQYDADRRRRRQEPARMKENKPE